MQSLAEALSHLLQCCHSCASMRILHTQHAHDCHTLPRHCLIRLVKTHLRGCAHSVDPDTGVQGWHCQGCRHGCKLLIPYCSCHVLLDLWVAQPGELSTESSTAAMYRLAL